MIQEDCIKLLPFADELLDHLADLSQSDGSFYQYL